MVKTPTPFDPESRSMLTSCCHAVSARYDVRDCVAARTHASGMRPRVEALTSTPVGAVEAKYLEPICRPLPTTTRGAREVLTALASFVVCRSQSVWVHTLPVAGLIGRAVT